MVWFWHVKNAAETTVKRQNYVTAPKLKVWLFIQMQKYFI